MLTMAFPVFLILGILAVLVVFASKAPAHLDTGDAPAEHSGVAASSLKPQKENEMSNDGLTPSRLLSVMATRRRQVSTFAILVFLPGCSNPEATAAQRGAGLPGHVLVATNYYQNNLSKCGDSHITTWTFSDRSGSRLVELKGVKYNTSPIPVSQADRLNGLEDAFDSWIEPTAVRETGSARGDWQAWRDVKTVFRFRFVKANGKWSAVIGGGEISGYMEKHPCDDVPGHPARLAREEAEQRLVSQARQVSAVTFKCGPVRDFSGYGTEMISVTDSSVIGVSGLPDTSVAFIDVQYFSNFDADRLDGPGVWLSDSGPYNSSGRWGFRFRGPAAVANRDACYEAIAASYGRWRSRFPTLAKLPPLSQPKNDASSGISAPRALEGIRSDICALASPLNGLYTDFSSYFLVDAMHSKVENPVKLDDRTDGPRTAALVKSAIGGIYIPLQDFPWLDPYGNEYQFVIGQRGNQLQIISVGRDHRVGGGDDVVFELSRGRSVGFITVPQGAGLKTCGN